MASHGDINAMIAAGRADMCALARGHLFDPYFTRHAAFQQGYSDLAWPDEYERVGSLTMRDF
jgi:anthraniloyl-CoA monooxygenase